MAVTRKPPIVLSTRYALHRFMRGGTGGNERLTAATGAALIAVLAVLGATIVDLRPLLWLHLFLGILVIPPVALKLGSTGYRFVRYYTSNPAYRRKGPPPAMLRLLAPLVVLSTIVMLASGVALLFVGPASRATLLPVHKVSFIVWGVVTGVHVLAHLPALPRALRADYAAIPQLGTDIGGRAARVISLAGTLVIGAVLAVLLVPQFTPWLHFHHLRH